MNTQTPAPPRLRARKQRDDRVIIATGGEDYPDEAPTVMAPLDELGIDADSLSDLPLPGVRAAEAPAMYEPTPQPRPHVRAREAAPRPVRHDTRDSDRLQLLMVIGLAVLPVVVALLGALWLIMS